MIVRSAPPRRRPWRGVVLAAIVVATACSGNSAPRITLDGSPRFANDQGVVTDVTLDRLTLDGSRRYRIPKNFRSFDSTTLRPVSLLSRKGMYVQIGKAGSRVDWLASYTLVVNVPGDRPTSFHSGKLKPPAKGRAVFSDGSVLDVAPGVAIPPAGAEARADIDVPTHRVRALTVTG